MAQQPRADIEYLDPSAETDLREGLALIDRELGDGLYALEDLQAAAADPTASVLVAKAGGRVDAIAVARLQVPDDIGYYLAFGEPARRVFRGGRIGSLEALAVAPRARNQGLGTELIVRRLRWFQEQGCDLAVAVSWLPKPSRPGTSAPRFRSLGFEESQPVADFYLEESRRDGWICPADGNPCHCSAILFWKTLKTPPGAP